MLRADELKRRTERLLAGHYSTADLNALFLWLRRRSFGCKTVADIGDFVAHADERDQGVAWKAADRFSAQLRFAIPRYDSVPGQYLPSTKADLEKSARSSFENRLASDFPKAFGMGKRKVGKLLNSALEAIHSFDGNMTTLTRPWTEKERMVMDQCANTISVHYAYNGDRLVRELLRCIEKNKLGDVTNVPEQFSVNVQLFAVERMHQSSILLEDGSRVSLAAGFGGEPDNVRAIQVSGEFQQAVKDRVINFRITIFSTALSADDWCEPELLTKEQSVFWGFPVEIGQSGKLKML